MKNVDNSLNDKSAFLLKITNKVNAEFQDANKSTAIAENLIKNKSLVLKDHEIDFLVKTAVEKRHIFCAKEGALTKFNDLLISSDDRPELDSCIIKIYQAISESQYRLPDFALTGIESALINKPHLRSGIVSLLQSVSQNQYLSNSLKLKLASRAISCNQFEPNQKECYQLFASNLTGINRLDEESIVTLASLIDQSKQDEIKLSEKGIKLSNNSIEARLGLLQVIEKHNILSNKNINHIESLAKTNCSEQEKLVINNILDNSAKNSKKIEDQVIELKLRDIFKNKELSFTDLDYVLKNANCPLRGLNYLYNKHIKENQPIPKYILSHIETLLQRKHIKPVDTALYVSLTDYIIRQNYPYIQDSTARSIITKLNDPENSLNLNQLLSRGSEFLITTTKTDLAVSLIAKENCVSNEIIFKALSKITTTENKLSRQSLNQLINLSVDPSVEVNIRQECLTLLHDCGQNLSKNMLAQLAANLNDKNLGVAQTTTNLIRDLTNNPGKHLDLIDILGKVISPHKEVTNDIAETLSEILSMQSTRDSSHLNEDSLNLVSDTLSTGSGNIIEDIEPVILSKAFNAEELIGQISELNDNPKIKELATSGILAQQLVDVHKYLEKDSVISPQDKSIGNWQENELLAFSNALIENPEKANNPENITEIIAAISQANQLHNGYKLRDTQILSILTLIQSPKGRLLQISTGEGKSTTTASLAAIKALQGHNIDIITSSPLLAKRDAAEWNGFFQKLNLSCSHNIDPNYKKGAKECYEHKIVYGDVATFQGDWLKTVHKDLGTFGNRKIDSIIVDEVDSMLIDGSNKLVKLSSPLIGAEYLSPIFLASWHALSNLSKQCIYLEEHKTHAFIGGEFEYKEGKLITDQNSFENITPIENIDKFKADYIEDYIIDLIEKRAVIIPSHIKDNISGEIKDWAASAVLAEKYLIKKDYLIVKNTQGEDIIAPIDYLNTGIVQANTVWENGLQQFLQAKHNLKITAKSDTTSFVSNMTYFRLYGNNISGLTGTLGSSNARGLLQDIYDLDCGFIPTYKAKQFTEYEPILVENRDQHLHEIVNSSKKLIEDKRSVLVICKTIKDVDTLEQALKMSGHFNNIVRYSRNDNDEHLITRNKLDSGTVIVATNLAGRGTDFKITNRLAAQGGLHVCVTFLPSNSRVEEQAFGRSARDGNLGSGQLILNKNNVLKSFKPYIEHLKLEPENIAAKHLKALRDLKENSRLQQAKSVDVPKLELNDKLFQKYNQLYQELKSSDNNQYKLGQLSEDWGNLFKNIRKEYAGSKLDHEAKSIKAIETFDQFKAEAAKRYHANSIISNPAYLVMQGFNALGRDNDYTESIELLSKAIELDDVYSFAARYNRAYALLRDGYKSAVGADKAYGGYIKYHQDVFNDLATVKAQIEGAIIPSLQSMQIILPKVEDNPLSRQIHNKIGLMQLLLRHVDNAIAAVQNGDVNEAMKVGNNPQLLTSFFDKNTMPRGEIEELQNFGIHRLYNVSSEEVGSHLANSIAVCVLAIAQTTFGALALMSGNVALGVSLVSSGFKDLYSASSVKEGGGGFRWNDYFVNKGIDIAIHYITIGAEKLLAAKTSTLSNEALKKNLAKDTVISEVKQEAKNQAIKKAIVQTALNTASNIAVNNLAKSIVKDKQKDIVGSIDRKIKNALTQAKAKESIQQILAADHYHGNSQYQDNIISNMSDFLSTKRHVLSDISSRLVSSLMHSQNAGISLLATGIKGTEIANEFNKVLSLTDEFCSTLHQAIDKTHAYTPKFEDLILKSLQAKGAFGQEDAKSVVNTLTQGGIWNGRTFDQSKLGFIEGIPSITEITTNKNPIPIQTEKEFISEINSSDLDKQSNLTLQNISLDKKYESARPRIIDTVHKLHKAISYDKTAQELDIANRLTSMLSNAINNRITGKVIMPVTSGVIQHFSSKLADHWVKDLKQEQSRFLGAKDELEEQFLLENYLNAQYRITGVSAGDSTYTLQKHEELLDINPLTKGEETDYVLKVHYRTTAFKKGEKPETVERDTSTGHIYYELVDASGMEVKSRFFSAYPDVKNDTLYNQTIGHVHNKMAEDSDNLDFFQHQEVIQHMKNTGEQILFSKVIFLNAKQFKTSLEFSHNFHVGKSYTLGINDCTDLGKTLFGKLDIPAEYNFLFSAKELSHALAGKKINAMYGNKESAFITKGDNIKQVAEQQKLPLDRVKKRYSSLSPTKPKISLDELDPHFMALKIKKDLEYQVLPPKKQNKDM